MEDMSAVAVPCRVSNLVSSNESISSWHNIGEQADDSISNSIAADINTRPKLDNKKVCSRTQVFYEIPRWGFTSVCGRRPEMEDAVAVKPRLMQIQSDTVMENGPGLVDAHFFGVYDGHGGCQVQKYR